MRTKMKVETFSSEQVLMDLKKKVNVYGSGRTAKMLGVPQSTVINTVRGRKGVGGVISAALGFSPVYIKAKVGAVLLGVLAIQGCSTGLQETAFRDESGTYIVSRSLVNDRVTANQPHVSGVFACDGKYTSEQMVELKKDGAEHSWYSTCQPIEQYRPGAYHATSDQPIATLYKGPVEAAILGAAVGTGLAMSGDTITQRGSSTAVAGASAQGGNAINKSGHRRR